MLRNSLNLLEYIVTHNSYRLRQKILWQFTYFIRSSVLNPVKPFSFKYSTPNGFYMSPIIFVILFLIHKLHCYEIK